MTTKKTTGIKKKKQASKKRAGGKKKAATKKYAAKRPLKAKVKRAPSAAFMSPVIPSASLGAVIGRGAMLRTEVTKRIWSYIKKNKLQDAKNKRFVNADEKLRGVFGGRTRVSMFEIAKIIVKNLRKETVSASDDPNETDYPGPRIK
jgi:chromatin remodeling complex protein RSC6